MDWNKTRRRCSILKEVANSNSQHLCIFMIVENSLANGSPKFARSYTPARFAKDLKYEGSKVPVEETSVRVYGVAYVILVSAQLKSPLNFAYVD